MRDVVFLLIVVGFFALAKAYVLACAAVVGAPPTPDADAHEAGDEEASA